MQHPALEIAPVLLTDIDIARLDKSLSVPVDPGIVAAPQYDRKWAFTSWQPDAGVERLAVMHFDGQ
jgi:hypothetical protein